MTTSDLEIKNAGVLSIVFVYFSLLFFDYRKIKNKVLTYGAICRSLGRDLKLNGVSNCKSRNLGIVSKFLPEDLRNKYEDFYSKRLYTGRLDFEEFIKYIKTLGLQKTGIEGKSLSPNLNFKELDIKNFQEITSKEYYNLIKGKKGTEIRIPVWCGKKEHRPWKGLLSNLLQGKWCGNCADEEKIIFSLERLKDLARVRGREETGVEGKILDLKNGNRELTKETYNKLTTKKMASKISFWWSCEQNHPPFRNNPANIRRGQWCPICSSKEGKFENIIRWYFEKIFGVAFPEMYLRDLNLKYTKMKIKLDLLKKKDKIKLVGYDVIYNNDNNKFKIYKGKMRFDGYAEVIIHGQLMKIAFEYNGIQHYKYPNYWFEESPDHLKAWLKYIKRDQTKKEICRMNNILLIEIPYYLDPALEHPKKIQSLIINKFESNTGLKLEICKDYNHREP